MAQSVVPLVLLTLEETANRLAISKRTLEREIARGNFPPLLKIGRASRVALADLVDYLQRLGAIAANHTKIRP